VVGTVVRHPRCGMIRRELISTSCNPRIPRLPLNPLSRYLPSRATLPSLLFIPRHTPNSFPSYKLQTTSLQIYHFSPTMSQYAFPGTNNTQRSHPAGPSLKPRPGRWYGPFQPPIPNPTNHPEWQVHPCSSSNRSRYAFHRS
jgi:hypothetical protein